MNLPNELVKELQREFPHLGQSEMHCAIVESLEVNPGLQAMSLGKAAAKRIRDRREWNSVNNRYSREPFPSMCRRIDAECQTILNTLKAAKQLPEYNPAFNQSDVAKLQLELTAREKQRDYCRQEIGTAKTMDARIKQTPPSTDEQKQQKAKLIEDGQAFMMQKTTEIADHDRRISELKKQISKLTTK
jgi:hypothetical protein